MSATSSSAASASTTGTAAASASLASGRPGSSESCSLEGFVPLLPLSLRREFFRSAGGSFSFTLTFATMLLSANAGAVTIYQKIAISSCLSVLIFYRTQISEYKIADAFAGLAVKKGALLKNQLFSFFAINRRIFKISIYPFDQLVFIINQSNPASF